MTYVPRLNRVFTLTASAITTTAILIPWRYTFYGAQADGPITTPTTSLPSVGKYAWSASLLGSHEFSDVDTSANIIAATITELEIGYNSVNEDGSPNTNLPLPGLLQDEHLRGKEIRFGPASLYPSSYVRFMAGGRSEYFPDDSRFGQFFFIEVDGDITLVGDAFTLESDDDVIITVEDQTAQASVDTPTEHKVFGELKELGVIQSISTSGSLITTSRDQSAYLTIRYDPRFLAGETVVDDLSRTWRVVSSRPISERRFIEYDMVLDVV